MLWAWLAAAQAAPVGFWHPDDLAPRSAVFMGSSEKLQGPFDTQSAASEKLAAALRQYREALDLLGAAAPASERTRLEALEKDYQRQHAVLQAFADQVIGDYDAAFMAAVERAVQGTKGEIEQCEAMVHTGPNLPGVPVHEEKNPSCHGEDLNAKLAATVDADPALKGALDEIMARAWPTVGLESAAQAPIGGAARWIAVRDLMVAVARKPMQAIDAADDEARTRIEAALESEATVEDLKKLEPEAKKIEADTAAKRAALAAPVLAAANARIAKKWTAEPATGWCANPTALGGCTGDDATRDLVARLVADKKVAKSFPQ